MTIEDTISALRRAYPDISKKVTYDVDKKGRDFCELILPNENNENMPITITVNSNGCLISAGRMLNISGNNEMTAQSAISAIEDILNDRIVFVYKYKNNEDFDDRKILDSGFFVLTGREDDTSGEFYDLVKKIEAPIKNKFDKLFSRYVGVFEILSFSGSFNRIIKRII